MKSGVKIKFTSHSICMMKYQEIVHGQTEQFIMYLSVLIIINLKEFLQEQKLHSRAETTFKKTYMGHTSKFQLFKPHQ